MLTIQLFEETDLKEVTCLFRNAFSRAPWNEEWAYDRAYRRLKAIYETDRFVGLVVYDKARVVGALLGNLEYWYEGDNYNLKELFVDPEYQGRGIGTQLLDALDRELEGYVIHEQVLLTLNTHETISFYEKKGYKKDTQIVPMVKK